MQKRFKTLFSTMKNKKKAGWNFAVRPSRLNLRAAAKAGAAKQSEINRQAKAAAIIAARAAAKTEN